MKACRLKIITANIINDIDFPEIHYVSQNIITYFNNIEKNDNKSEIKNTPTEEETQKTNNTTSYTLATTEQQLKKVTEKIEIKNENKNQNINNNELYTISKNNKNTNNDPQSTINLYFKNYPYDIKTKKKDLKNTNKYLFKNRVKHNTITEKINKKSNKSISKNKTKNNNFNFTKKLSKSSNNISCENNKSNKNNNKNNENSPPLINNNLNNSNQKDLLKLSTKTSNDIQINNINITSKDGINNTSLINNIPSSQVNGVVTWKVIEKFDNLDDNYDYKDKIEELLSQECQLIKQKDQIIQHFEQKLKPLRELNEKLIEDNNEELNREDELKGEYIIFKNQYEKLFNQLNSLKQEKFYPKNYEIKTPINTTYQEIFDIKQKEIENENKNLIDLLKNGEFLIVTKPVKYDNLSNEEFTDIALMIRGILYSYHIFDYNKLINIIWKHDKPVQTIYFLVNEFMNFSKLTKKIDRDKLINFFYSFCQKFHYISKKNFTSLLEKKLGVIIQYNRFLYFNKILNFYRRKIRRLVKYLKSKDEFFTGITQYLQLLSGLEYVGINVEEERVENFKDFKEFLIYCMKRNKNITLPQKKQIENTDQSLNNIPNENKSKEKEINENIYDIYNLYYGNLIDFNNEFKANSIYDYFTVIRRYMKENEISSAKVLFKPLMIKENIFSLDNKDYIDIIVLNKYLKLIGIINKKQRLFFPTYEDELVDMNLLINDIDDLSKNYVEPTPEEIKENVEKFIDEIIT